MKPSGTGTRQIGFVTAASIVIANMIGTGVFTSLGFQTLNIRSVFPLLMLWVVGGVIALCGALSYGELGAALPRSGGEYHLLSRIYHPALGFLSGWISVTVGFAAPAALAAIALGTYLKTILGSLPVQHVAAISVVAFTIIHSSSIRIGSYSHNLLTALKIILIVGFIIAASRVGDPEAVGILPQLGDFKTLSSADFAVSLIYVSFAYAGWNAAIYVVGEIKNPQRNLPKALFLGTLLVSTLYLLLNYVFLYTVSIENLAGQIEVGYLSGIKIFGATGGKIMSGVIAFLLISTVSGHVFVGPRIMRAMGEDYHAIRLLQKTSRNNIPVNAFLFQLLIMLIMIYTSTFEQVMIYAGFTLNLVTTLTVAGVFVLRKKEATLPRPYKTWGYPITPIIFLVMSIWTLTFVMIKKPFESSIGLGVVLLGILVYFLNRHLIKSTVSNQ